MDFTTPDKFAGSLNRNDFLQGLFNAYALVYLYASNIGDKTNDLSDRFRMDAGDYRDKSVFTDVDVLFSRVWDKTDTNVLATEYKGAYRQEEIVANQYRQIGLTVDKFLTKQAWMDEGKYDAFRTVILKQISETKRVYEDTMINTYVGVYSNTGKQTVTVAMPTDADAEKQNKLRAMEVFKDIADIYGDLADYSRDYNLNGFLKKFGQDDLIVLWNKKYVNEFRYVDTPAIYHKDDLIAKGYILNSRYFGDLVTDFSTVTTADGISHRATEEMIIPVDAKLENYKAPVEGVTNYAVHVFCGDLLPKGTPIGAKAETEKNVMFGLPGSQAPATDTVYTKAVPYKEDPLKICKIVHKDSVKYLSGITTQTEFINGKNHTFNHYLTWRFAYPKTLKGYPFITVVADKA